MHCWRFQIESIEDDFAVQPWNIYPDTHYMDVDKLNFTRYSLLQNAPASDLEQNIFFSQDFL